MAQWFVLRDGQQRGPFEEAKLKELATAGKLRPSDLLRRADGAGERRVKDIPTLSSLLTPSSVPSPPPIAAKTKSKFPWVTVIVLVGLSLSVARLLNAVKNNRLRAGNGTTQTNSTAARPKRHSGEPTLRRSGDQSPEVLTADFIPSRIGAKWTETHTLHKASNGKPDVQWRVTCEQSGPGEITQSYNKVFPSKDGKDRKKQELYSESDTTVQTAILQGNPTPEWVPLIYKGAHVGDSWKDEQSTWTLQSLNTHDGKTLAVIERYSDIVLNGERHEITELYTIEKGVGVVKRVQSGSIDGVPFPFPSYTEEREGHAAFSSSPSVSTKQSAPERVQQAESTRQTTLQVRKAPAAPDGPMLTADYLPHAAVTATYIETWLHPRTGEPYGRHRDVFTPTPTGYQICRRTIFPAGQENWPMNFEATLFERNGAVWYVGEPLVCIGASVGDTWRAKDDSVFTLKSFQGEAQQDAVIEQTHENTTPDGKGDITFSRETIVLRRGVGIMSRRWDAVTNGSGYTHPDRTIRRVD
jgi:hypothetical protein